MEQEYGKDETRRAAWHSLHTIGRTLGANLALWPTFVLCQMNWPGRVCCWPPNFCNGLIVCRYVEFPVPVPVRLQDCAARCLRRILVASSATFWHVSKLLVFGSRVLKVAAAVNGCVLLAS